MDVKLPEASKHVRSYYHDLDRNCDYIVRCRECRRLVVGTELAHDGLCPHCGTRHMIEVRELGFWEWLKIRLGILDFPHRDLFLKEFSLTGWWYRG